MTAVARRRTPLTLVDLGVAAGLAVEALGLCPAEALRLQAGDPYPRLGVVVTNHFHGSVHVRVKVLPLRADVWISEFHRQIVVNSGLAGGPESLFCEN